MKKLLLWMLLIDAILFVLVKTMFIMGFGVIPVLFTACVLSAVLTPIVFCNIYK